MANNLPSKRYSKDIGVPVPNVEFCPTEFPRMMTFPAPYLPLQQEDDRHDEFYVVMTGKVLALDSMGFVVPAGLTLDLEVMNAAVTAQKGGNLDATTADGDNHNMDTLTRYDATDVANSVVNSRGVAAALNEPVVYSMIRVDGNPLANYAEGVAATSTAVPIANAAVTEAVSIGNHIGVAPYSFLRTASDALSRSGNPLHGDLSNTSGARVPFDPTQFRHRSWELQDFVTVRTNYCLVYPVVTDRNDILLEGQAVAVAAAMANFPLGGRVTFNKDSDIVSHSASLTTSDYSQDADATIDSRIELAIQKYHDRTVGQVIRKNTRFPSSYLDRVSTRWGSDVPGFSAIDATAGSATSGYPPHMHKAGGSETLGEIQISLFMR